MKHRFSIIRDKLAILSQRQGFVDKTQLRLDLTLKRSITIAQHEHIKTNGGRAISNTKCNKKGKQKTEKDVKSLSIAEEGEKCKNCAQK